MGLTDSEIAVVDGRDETGLRAGCALTGPHATASSAPLTPQRTPCCPVAEQLD